MVIRWDREHVIDGVSIFREGKKGLFRADFHYKGQHRYKALKTTNKKRARQLAIQVAADILRGQLSLSAAKPAAVVIASVTIDEARESFIAGKKVDGKQPKTLAKYDGTLRNFRDFCEKRGVKRLDQVTLTVVDAYRAYRRSFKVRGKELSETQMHHDATLLKRFLEWCTQRMMISENPLATQRFPRPQLQRTAHVPTLEEVDAILAAAPPQIFAPLAVLAFTGMRSGNCRQLLVEDIDLAGGWAHVRSRVGARSKVGNEWSVPIHPRLDAVLRALEMPQVGYLFTAPPSHRYPQGGHWINTKHLNDDFVKVVKKLGMPAGKCTGFTVHSLRHFFKSFCISHGVPREYVDAWQGHTSIRAASDLYVHTFDRESHRLINLVPFGDGTPAANAGSQPEKK